MSDFSSDPGAQTASINSGSGKVIVQIVGDGPAANSRFRAHLLASEDPPGDPNWAVTSSVAPPGNYQ